jgi:proteasome lid subunit RPN8/RPN11
MRLPARSSATIHLPGALTALLLAHARAELPNEACGLLGGDPSAGRATSFHATRNGLASPLRYDVDAEDLIGAMFAIESAGEELIAIFHSHPRSPAVPSATDVREARYDVVHLIASLAEPLVGAPDGIRAWRIRDGSAAEIEVRISE